MDDKRSVLPVPRRQLCDERGYGARVTQVSELRRCVHLQAGIGEGGDHEAELAVESRVLEAGGRVVLQQLWVAVEVVPALVVRERPAGPDAHVDDDEDHGAEKSRERGKPIPRGVRQPSPVLGPARIAWGRADHGLRATILRP
jgi:hypothetical protein